MGLGLEGNTPLCFTPDDEPNTILDSQPQTYMFSLAKSSQISPKVLLLAGLNVLHFRHTSLEDVVTGQ